MKNKNLNYALLILSLVGAILSTLLIFEYFNLNTELVSSLCGITGDGDSCSQVAKSDYSGIRGVPVLGDIPIALFGFMFYLFLGFLFYKYHFTTDILFLKLSLLLTSLGLVIDLGLFFISIFVLETICGLCFTTYLISIAIFIVLIIIQKSKNEKINFQGLLPFIKSHLQNFGIVILVLFTISFSIGKFGNSEVIVSEKDFNKKIEEMILTYENSPILPISLENTPIIGDPQAPITIVKYADFNCGHCMETSHILKEFLNEFHGVIKIAYKNFPLDGTCNRLVSRPRPGGSSCIAASASICADKQGKFKEMYEALYSNTEKGVSHTISSVLQIANSNSLNSSSFQQCLGSKAVQTQINSEVNEAEVLKIQSTPSLFVNNKAIPPGTPNVLFLKALILHLMSKS